MFTYLISLEANGFYKVCLKYFHCFMSKRAIDVVDDESLDLYSPIYFGDSSVNVGEPFKINCRISISTPTEWLKDGESIRKHNLRHGRDDHSYVVTENEIEGRNKINSNFETDRWKQRERNKSNQSRAWTYL